MRVPATWRIAMDAQVFSEVGSFDGVGFFGTEGAIRLLWSVDLNADMPGVVNFTAGAADSPTVSDVLVFGSEDSVALSELSFDSVAVTISDAPPWQYPRDRFDVNDDTLVTPTGDVLIVINELNRQDIISETGALPIPPVPPRTPPPFYDVNGDNLLTAVGDALTLINRINQQGVAEGEGSQELRITRLAPPRTLTTGRGPTSGPSKLPGPERAPDLLTPPVADAIFAAWSDELALDLEDPPATYSRDSTETCKWPTALSPCSLTVSTRTM